MSQLSDDDIRKLAREIYSSDEVQVDSNAKVSRGDDEGAYVQAWVWVGFITE